MIVIKFWMTCLLLLMSTALLAAVDVSNQDRAKYPAGHDQRYRS